MTALASANAQQTSAKVNILFGFTVDEVHMPTGEYVISSPNQKVVTIRARGGGLAKSTITNSDPSTKSDGHAKVILHRYGSQYFVVAAWMPNAGHAQELFASASENQTARGKERQEIYTLLMESVR